MGEKNSSLTRVQPVFNALLDRDLSGSSWLPRLCEIAANTKPAAVIPAQVGPLVPAETPVTGSREGKVFERIVPPPTAFLRWLLEHPERMEVRNAQTLGTGADGAARDWRRKLFSDSPELRQEATAEGVRQLQARGARVSGRQWWAFEGFSHIDCCLITEKVVLFVEGKRTESVSPATLWFTQRSQLWRNVEVAQEFAAGRQFGVVLAVETEVDGREALKIAGESLADSYPHLGTGNAQQLGKHLLGFVTWSDIVTEFTLPPSCLPDTVTSRQA